MIAPFPGLFRKESGRQRATFLQSSSYRESVKRGEGWPIRAKRAKNGSKLRTEIISQEAEQNVVTVTVIGFPGFINSFGHVGCEIVVRSGCSHVLEMYVI